MWEKKLSGIPFRNLPWFGLGGRLTSGNLWGFLWENRGDKGKGMRGEIKRK